MPYAVRSLPRVERMRLYSLLLASAFRREDPIFLFENYIEDEGTHLRRFLGQHFSLQRSFGNVFVHRGWQDDEKQTHRSTRVRFRSLPSTAIISSLHPVSPRSKNHVNCHRERLGLPSTSSPPEDFSVNLLSTLASCSGKNGGS